MIPPRSATRAVSWAEAHVWADVLVRYGLLDTALPTPSGQWIVRLSPHGPVEVLTGPCAMLDLAARLQLRSRKIHGR